jgi:hypothetical protein
MTVTAPRRLSTGECRDWLVSHREGRLGYQSGRGPRSVVVSYAVTGDQIMFQLPDYNDIVHYAPGEEIILEVDGTLASRGDFETVSVKGTARLATGQQEQEVDTANFEEHWPTGVSTSVICLPMTDIEGFERNAAPGRATPAMA